LDDNVCETRPRGEIDWSIGGWTPSSDSPVGGALSDGFLDHLLRGGFSDDGGSSTKLRKAVDKKKISGQK